MKRMLAVLAYHMAEGHRVAAAMVCAVISAVLVRTAMADIVWVDNKLDDYAGHDGTTSNLAYRTIQEGINKAQSGWTVCVRRGTYGSDQGVVASPKSVNSRVLLNKKNIHLLAEEGREVTHIVGAWHDPAGRVPTGENAVRCITANNASGCVIEGFTLRDGAAPTELSDSTGFGGGFCDEYGAKDVHLVDCAITGCYATRSSAAAWATLVRTLVADNDNLSNSNGSTVRNCDFYNCILTRNSGTYVMSYCGKAVGCTVTGNNVPWSLAALQSVSDGVYNTLIANNVGRIADASTPLYNCVYNLSGSGSTLPKSETDCDNAASLYQVAAPVFGDFRPVARAPMTTVGSVEHLSLVPEDYRALDFNRKPRSVDGKVSIGAIQETYPATECRVVLANPCKVDDREPMYFSAQNNYFFPDAYPKAFRVKDASGSPIFQWKTTEFTFFPDLDDTFAFVPPASGEVTVTPVYPTAELYVSPTGSGKRDGTSANDAFGSLQAAVEAAATGASDYTLIRAASGDYKEGGEVAGSHSNRVVIKAQVRLLGAGAGKSSIFGASGSGTDGCGPEAMRCVAFSEGNAAVQGFTLTGGRSDLGTSGTDLKGNGGAVYSSSANSGSVLDCVISNSVASRGGAARGGQYYRCHITGRNKIVSGGNGIIWYARLISCIVDNNYTAENQYGVLGNGSYAYFSSIDGQASAGQSRNTLNGALEFSNTIYLNAGDASQFTGSAAGSIVYKTYKDPIVPGCRIVDPKLVGAAMGDFQPYPDSPAFGGGSTDTVADFRKYLSSDFYGNLPTFSADGKPTVGAIQVPVHLVSVQAEKSRNLIVSGGAVGAKNVVSRGATLTVAVAESKRWLFEGFVVNGEQLPKDVYEWSFMAPLVGYEGQQDVVANFRKPGLLLIVE